MRSSLRTLVTDLEIRSRLAGDGLASVSQLSGRTPAAVAQFRHIASEARRLLGQDLEGEPERFYPVYQGLARSFLERETFELPFLSFHDQAAARATKLCSVLLENVNWPYESILVSTFSSQYYWTVAGWRVVALPCGEERRLLGVPDLCHELGHTVYSQDDKKLVGDFLIALRAELMALIDPSAPPGQWNSQEQLTDVFYAWEEGWLQEFVCDLVATFLVGPAFPKQHMRLRGMIQPPRSPFFALDLGASHPADDARMQASLLLLRHNGFDKEADESASLWTEMVDFCGESAPVGYEAIYSKELLATLVDKVVTGCYDVGLRPFDPNANSAVDIPMLTNEAWEVLFDDPEDFGRWEANKLAELWKVWGL